MEVRALFLSVLVGEDGNSKGPEPLPAGWAEEKGTRRSIHRTVDGALAQQVGDITV